MTATLPNTTCPGALISRLQHLKHFLMRHAAGFPHLRDDRSQLDVRRVEAVIGAPEGRLAIDRGPQCARRFLDACVREIGLSKIELFEGALADDPTFGFKGGKASASIRTLSRYLDELSALGVGIPTKNGRDPFWKQIAFDAGIHISRTFSHHGFRDVINGAKATLGLTPLKAYLSKTRNLRMKMEAEHAGRVQILRSFLQAEYLARHRGLPEDDKKPGVPAYNRILDQAGIIVLGPERDQELYSIIDTGAQRVGLGEGRQRPPLNVAMVTYKQLISLGIARRAAEQDDQSQTTIARFESAVRTFYKGLRKEAHDLVGDDLTHDFGRNLELVSGNHTEESRRRWKANMRKWKAIYDEVAHESHSSETSFATTFQRLMQARGIDTVEDFIAEAGLEAHATEITLWHERKSEPAEASIDLVARVETFFAVAPGALMGLVRNFFGKSGKPNAASLYPPSLSGKKLRAYARPLLPANWAYLPMSLKEEIGLDIREEYNTSIAHRQRARSGYRKRIVFNPHLQAGWNDLVEYKTKLISSEPRATRWTSEATTDRNAGTVSGYFTALALPKEEGGAECDPANFRLAHLVSIRGLQIFCEFEFKDNGGCLNGDWRAFTGICSTLSTDQAHTRGGQKTNVPGFIRMHHKYALEIARDDPLFSEAEFEEIQTPDGWQNYLTRFNQLVWQTWADVGSGIQRTRDPSAPIKPILESETPLDALTDMTDACIAALPDPNDSQLSRAVAVRRCLLVIVVNNTLLRVGSIASTKCYGSGSGSLTKIGDGWRLFIPKSDLKAEGQLLRFTDGFTFVFPSEYNSIIDEYMKVSRPLLLNNKVCDSLFITRDGNAMTADSLSNDYRMQTWKHVVYHEVTGTGVRGTEAFSTHAGRHVGGTDIIKNTNNPNLAADALLNSPRTILKVYAFVAAEHRTKKVGEYMSKRRGDRRASRRG